MRLTTSLFLIFVYFINISMSINVIQDKCSCSCCIGIGCNLVQRPDFYIPFCSEDDAACVTYCKMIYPYECSHIYSQTFAVCISDAPKTSNQYMVLFLSILFLGLF